MANITKKRVSELQRGVFEVLVDCPDGLSVKEVLQRVEKKIPPTEFENSTYPNHPTIRRYDKIIRFHTIQCVKAGWLIKNKGDWSLTDEGIKAFRQFKDPEEFYAEAGRLYKVWKDEQPVEETEESEEDPTTQAAMTLEEAEEAAWSEIKQYLQELSPYDFQDLVAGLLRGMGYFVDWISPPGPDKGIDIIAHTDPLGVKGPRIKVQVKRYAGKISVDGIRGFISLLGNTDVGLFICMGGFTKDAEDEARRQENRRIMLIDLKRLFDLWTEHYHQIPEAKRQLLPLRPVYFLSPDE